MQKPLLKRVMNIALNKYYENDVFYTYSLLDFRQLHVNH